MSLKNDLVAHFREEREELRAEWLRAMNAKHFLNGLTEEEADAESQVIYDTCVEVLATGKYAGAQDYAERMAKRGVLQGMSPDQILGGMLTLRDVYGRSLFRRYSAQPQMLAAALDIYEPVANQILTIVSMAFISERERLVTEQQQAIRELSTPVLRIRDKLLILPLIGLLDAERGQQLTGQLLQRIREYRAKAVVIDITGVPVVDELTASQLLTTIEAVRLLGASVIVSGVSPEIALTITALGMNHTKMETVVDLQGAIEIADQMLGYKIILTERNGG